MQAPQDLQSMRDRVTGWMADGRADLVVEAWSAEMQEPWKQDPYLMLQYGDALGYLDRLADAERVFTNAQDLEAASPAQKDFARSRLTWLAEEWGRIDDVRGGLGRALTVGVAGSGVVAAVAALAWILGRRNEISSTPRVEHEH